MIEGLNYSVKSTFAVLTVNYGHMTTVQFRPQVRRCYVLWPNFSFSKVQSSNQALCSLFCEFFYCHFGKIFENCVTISQNLCKFKYVCYALSSLIWPSSRPMRYGYANSWLKLYRESGSDLQVLKNVMHNILEILKLSSICRKRKFYSAG